MQNDASGAFLPPNMRTFSAVDRSFCGESRERFDVEGVDATSATASSLKFDMSGGDFSSGGGENGPPAADPLREGSGNADLIRVQQPHHQVFLPQTACMWEVANLGKP